MQHEDSRIGAAAAPQTQEALAGFVERVTFHRAENGFCVLRTKARGQKLLGRRLSPSAANADTAIPPARNRKAYSSIVFVELSDR